MYIYGLKGPYITFCLESVKSQARPCTCHQPFARRQSTPSPTRQHVHPGSPFVHATTLQQYQRRPTYKLKLDFT